RNTLLDAMASQFAKDQDVVFPVVGTGDDILSRPPMMHALASREPISSRPFRYEFSESEESASDRRYQPAKRISAREKNWGRRVLTFGAIAAILFFLIVPSGVLYLLFHSSNPNHTFADNFLERLNEIQQQDRKVETLQPRRQASSSDIAQRLLELGHKLI